MAENASWKETVRAVYRGQEALAAYLIAVAATATAPHEDAAPVVVGVASAHVGAALTCSVVHEARAIQRAGNPAGTTMASLEQRKLADHAARGLAGLPRLLSAMREHLPELEGMPLHHAAVEALVNDAMNAFEVAQARATDGRHLSVV